MLVACLTANSLYLSLSHPYIASPPASLALLVTISLFSVSVSLLLFLFYLLVCCIFESPHVSDYHTEFVFVCLTYFTYIM